jgi:hypothetical protein
MHKWNRRVGYEFLFMVAYLGYQGGILILFISFEMPISSSPVMTHLVCKSWYRFISRGYPLGIKEWDTSSSPMPATWDILVSLGFQI